ncbi:hypothetical protein, partial [Plastoroseomonas hellenica]|uniref:hypothetical protein n=1 Tax=Plastoroseomonas hellenica TaxID=2687306 RepID=UPI001BA6077D
MSRTFKRLPGRRARVAFSPAGQAKPGPCDGGPDSKSPPGAIRAGFPLYPPAGVRRQAARATSGAAATMVRGAVAGASAA